METYSEDPAPSALSILVILAKYHTTGDLHPLYSPGQTPWNTVISLQIVLEFMGTRSDDSNIIQELDST